MILVAPDSFKGTLSATQVAAALGRGIERAGASAELLPLADGGEGTCDVLLGALGGRTVEVAASDPLGRPVQACFGLLDDGETAIVEVAAASGLGLVAAGERDAEAASSYGTGELIAAAVDQGARRVLVAAGGSATTDGGAGALDAIAAGGGLRGARLVVLCDVATPFELAAATFAPQKGAGAAAVERLAARLDAFAARLPRDPRGLHCSGAAGGLAGGLWAAHDAELVAGAPFVLDAVGFDKRAARAAAVIGGEGRIDVTTLEGKLLTALCRRSPVPVHAVCGEVAVDAGVLADLGLASVHVAGDEARLVLAGSAIAEMVGR